MKTSKSNSSHGELIYYHALVHRCFQKFPFSPIVKIHLLWPCTIASPNAAVILPYLHRLSVHLILACPWAVLHHWLCDNWLGAKIKEHRAALITCVPQYLSANGNASCSLADGEGEMKGIFGYCTSIYFSSFAYKRSVKRITYLILLLSVGL